MSPMAETVKVAIVGTGDGGIQPGTLITPGSAPNLVVKVVGPMFAIVIRFINTYLTTLVGLVAAGMVSNVMPAHDFAGLVAISAKLSLAGAVFGFLKDCLTVFSRLETRYPLLTGSI